jgi:hypothetical protein
MKKAKNILRYLWGKRSKMGNSVSAKFCDDNGVKRLELTRAEAW